MRRRVAALVAAALLAGGGSALAATRTPGDPGPYAPLDRPGPRLSVPVAALRASLACPWDLARSRREPVLLVPGTTLDPDQNFAWNYKRDLRQRGIPFCTVTLPQHATGDVTVAGQHVVYALRELAARTHRKVQVVGFSQGGMVPRWALRFWPDTRALVDDVIGIDPSNHGTVVAHAVCQVACDAANWQQSDASHFTAALNSGAETFRGIDYTVVYSRTDEVVVPNTEAASSSALRTGQGRIANILAQSVCPGDVSEHLAMGSYDPVAEAVVVDALTHPGPASAARISAGTCTRAFQPGVDPATFATDFAGYLAAVGQNSATAAELPAEPPLPRYAFR